MSTIETAAEFMRRTYEYTPTETHAAIGARDAAIREATAGEVLDAVRTRLVSGAYVRVVIDNLRREFCPTPPLEMVRDVEAKVFVDGPTIQPHETRTRHCPSCCDAIGDGYHACMNPADPADPPPAPDAIRAAKVEVLRDAYQSWLRSPHTTSTEVLNKNARAYWDALAARHGIDPAELEAKKYTVGDIKVEPSPVMPLRYEVWCGEYEWDTLTDRWVPRGKGTATGDVTAEAIAAHLRATNNVPTKGARDVQ